MLRNLKIQDCYAHADECGRNAEAAFLSEMRDNFLRLRQIWLDLARSYELAERLGPAQSATDAEAPLPANGAYNASVSPGVA